jgi:hypothetical protein
MVCAGLFSLGMVNSGPTSLASLFFPLFEVRKVDQSGNYKRYSASHCVMKESRLFPFMTQQSKASCIWSGFVRR